MRYVLATMDGQPLLLAQPDVADNTSATTEQAGDGSTDGGGGNTSLFSNPVVMMVLFGMLILWIFLLGGGSRKQKKKQQQELLASMSKGSKVVTIGGIKGSVVEVREDEVVVKVDENNNTRMKFSKDAIRTVAEGSGSGKGGDKAEKTAKAEKADDDESAVTEK